MDESFSNFVEISYSQAQFVNLERTGFSARKRPLHRIVRRYAYMFRALTWKSFDLETKPSNEMITRVRLFTKDYPCYIIQQLKLFNGFMGRLGILFLLDNESVAGHLCIPAQPTLEIE